MTDLDLRLGDRVRFTRTLRRRHTTDRRQLGKEWTAERWPGDTGDLPARDGLVIGVRTLSDGDVDRDWEAGSTYTPRRHFRAYLVAYALHRRPVLVLPEHLQPLDNTGADDDANGPLCACGNPATISDGRTSWCSICTPLEVLFDFDDQAHADADREASR